MRKNANKRCQNKRRLVSTFMRIIKIWNNFYQKDRMFYAGDNFMSNLRYQDQIRTVSFSKANLQADRQTNI